MSVAPALPGVFQTLAPVLDHYGYLAVGGFVFLEDFGVPVPGETVLIAAAVYAGAGKLNILAVALIGFAAAVLGDNVGFGIGHFGGQPFVRRFGRYVLLTEERFTKATGWFDRHGGKVVTIARFVEGLRQANGIVAGAARMHWLRFIAFNAVGAALWVAVWTAVGDVSGTHIAAVYGAVTHYVGFAALAVVLLLVARYLLRRRGRGERPASYPVPANDAAAETSSASGADPLHRGK